MQEWFAAHLASSGLIPPRTRVLVGYSGGPDSTCLLHLLHGLGIDVVAAHLHHGQRPEADREMELCAAFCAELDVPFASGRADVPRLAKDLKIGLEEAGRHARYEFFYEAAHRLQARRIATAHTRDDQLETLLLNITRGCGIGGLAGIPEQRNALIRPLLPLGRTQTRQYCVERGLWFHDDPANTDLGFARARMRHRVVPELARINPNFAQALARLSGMALEEDRYLDGIAAAALEHCERPLNGVLAFLTRDIELAFDRPTIAALHPVPRSRALRLAVEHLGAKLDYRHTARANEAIVASPSGSITAPGAGVVLDWDAHFVRVRRLQQDSPYRFPLTVPGETDAESFGWRLVAHPHPGTDFRRPLHSLEAVIDHGATRGALYFRGCDRGDEIVPLGAAVARSLANMLRTRGLTAAARRRLPIVCDATGPLWAPGVALADRVKVTPSTSRALLLRLEPLAPDAA